jgi:hypothetical protein
MKTYEDNLYIGIDPGPKKSGSVIYSANMNRVIYSANMNKGAVNNNDVVPILESELNRYYWDLREKESLSHRYRIDISVYMSIEKPESRGQKTPQTVLDTAIVAGYLFRSLEYMMGNNILSNEISFKNILFIYPRNIKICLTGNVRGNTKDALLDRIGSKGTTKDPGPTFGVCYHSWDALAVAITMLDITNGVFNI